MHGQGVQWPFCEDLPPKTPDIPQPGLDYEHQQLNSWVIGILSKADRGKGSVEIPKLFWRTIATFWGNFWSFSF